MDDVAGIALTPEELAEIGLSMDDFNFDKVEEDQDLLVELEDLGPDAASLQVQVGVLDAKVKELGQHAVALKQAGDIPAAKLVMKQYKLAKAELEQTKGALEVALAAAESGAEGQNILDGMKEEIDQVIESVKVMKRRALASKRAGDRAAALKWMKEAKAIEEKLSALEEDWMALGGSCPDHLPVKAVSEEANMPVLDMVQIEDLAQELYKQYMTRSLEFKRDGKMKLYKKVSTEAKQIRKLISDGLTDVKLLPLVLSQRLEYDLAAEESIDEPEVAESKSIVSPTLPQKSETAIVKSDLEYSAIISKMHAQINAITDETVRYKELATSKGNTVESGAAIKTRYKELLMKKKAYQKELGLVIEAKNSGYPAPSYRLSHERITKEYFFPEIPTGQIMVHFRAGKDFVPPSGWDIATSYLCVDFAYKGSDSQTFQSHVIKDSNSPVFDWKCYFQLPPKCGRGFKFAKFSVSVFCPRTIFKDTLLGQGDVKLADVLELAEFEKVLNVKIKGKTTGQLDVCVRVRQPLQGRDLRKVDQEILIIEEFRTAASEPIHVAKDAEASGKHAAEVNSMPLDINQRYIDNPNHLELFVSFDVLSEEFKIVGNKISVHRCKDEPVPKIMEQVYNELQVKMMLLQRDVEEGVLSLEDYLKNVSKSVDVHLALLRILKSQSRVPEAKQVMKRYKIMKAEIELATET